MKKLKTYKINPLVVGLEANPDEFEEFLKYMKNKLRGLMEYKRMDDTPSMFEVSVPTDTNLFMFGALWYQWEKAML